MPCIESIIPCHHEMLFRYVLDKQGNKVQDRESLYHIRIILMFIVMESDIFAIIGIDPGSGNDRTAEVAADVFDDSIGVAEIGLGIDIETIFIHFVNGSLSLFERRADTLFQFIKKCGLESLAQVSVVEMFYNSPEAVIRKAAFDKEAVDMWIPFQRPAEGVQDADKTRDEVSALIHLVKKPEDDTADGLEKAVEQGTVIEEESAQIFINGEDNMSVSAAEEFEGHFSGAVNAVLVTTGRTKFGMAAKGDEFKFAAMSTAIHGSTERGIPTVNHFFDVFHDNGTGMKDIFNFFIVFFKNLLKNVHKSIMQEMWPESNPLPSRLRGRGS